MTKAFAECVLGFSALALVGDGSMAALQAQFGGRVTARAKPTPQIRYCPDNTCDVFTGLQTTRAADLADFALMYLWGVSQYIELEEWRRGMEPRAVGDAYGRHRGRCGDRLTPAGLACALRTLAKSGGVAVSFLRHDEGVDHEAPVNLEEELSRLAQEPENNRMQQTGSAPAGNRGPRS